MQAIQTLQLQQQCERFCGLLDQALYYEAHEALEEIWFPRRFDKADEIRLIRAYINAAVSFELHKRKRPHAAVKPWGFFQKHRTLIEATPSHHYEIYSRVDQHISKIYSSLVLE